MRRNHAKAYMHVFPHHQLLFGANGHPRSTDLVADALITRIPRLAIIADAKPQAVAARDSPFTPVGHVKTSVAARMRLA